MVVVSPAPCRAFLWCRAQALGVLGLSRLYLPAKARGSSWEERLSSGPPAFTGILFTLETPGKPTGQSCKDWAARAGQRLSIFK